MSDAPELNEEDMVRRLQAVIEDERAGRVVRCTTEAELREFFASLMRQAV